MPDFKHRRANRQPASATRSCVMPDKVCYPNSFITGLLDREIVESGLTDGARDRPGERKPRSPEVTRYSLGVRRARRLWAPGRTAGSAAASLGALAGAGLAGYGVGTMLSEHTRVGETAEGLTGDVDYIVTELGGAPMLEMVEGIEEAFNFEGDFLEDVGDVGKILGYGAAITGEAGLACPRHLAHGRRERGFRRLGCDMGLSIRRSVAKGSKTMKAGCGVTTR